MFNSDFMILYLKIKSKQCDEKDKKALNREDVENVQNNIRLY